MSELVPRSASPELRPPSTVGFGTHPPGRQLNAFVSAWADAERLAGGEG